VNNSNIILDNNFASYSRKSSNKVEDKENMNLNLNAMINKQLNREMNEIYKDKSNDIVITTFIECEDCGEMLTG